jgi:hypothetical protein
MRATILWVGLALLMACYVYDSEHLPSPAPGTAVEAQLTGDGTEALTRLLGPDIVAVQGHILESTSTDLVLSLNSVTPKGQDRIGWKGEQVRIPVSAVAKVQQRRFSLGRSILIGGAAIGALVAASGAFEGEGSATNAPGPGGGAGSQ